VDKTLSYEVKNDKWKLENCSVVGVVINTNTKEIITAGMAKVQ
jgi:outer membrane protein omp28